MRWSSIPGCSLGAFCPERPWSCHEFGEDTFWQVPDGQETPEQIGQIVATESAKDVSRQSVE